ncbi:MAG: hypothetical protein V2J24_22325 [Pseudomonadales bacterium]|nr:hypothetical protein [Pseudomonadales bacterium]
MSTQTPQLPESRIDTALGTILRNFNFLELNLGLSIRALEHPEDVERSHSWLSKSSIQEKIDRFSELVKAIDGGVDEEEIERWRRAVLRDIRN